MLDVSEIVSAPEDANKRNAQNTFAVFADPVSDMEAAEWDGALKGSCTLFLTAPLNVFILLKNAKKKKRQAAPTHPGTRKCRRSS